MHKWKWLPICFLLLSLSCIMTGCDRSDEVSSTAKEVPMEEELRDNALNDEEVINIKDVEALNRLLYGIDISEALCLEEIETE